MYQFKISRNKNINKNIPLAKRCKKDADKFCNVTWFFGYKSGQVISCLRDVKKQVSKGCKQQLFKIQLDGAKDFRADPNLYEACKDDAVAQCKGIKNGGGRIQGCLRDKRMSLTWACEEQLFRQEMENADDIRLSVRLFAKCLPDKRKFCKVSVGLTPTLPYPALPLFSFPPPPSPPPPRPPSHIPCHRPYPVFMTHSLRINLPHFFIVHTFSRSFTHLGCGARPCKGQGMP